MLVLFLHWRLVVFIIDLFQIVVVVILKMSLSYRRLDLSYIIHFVHYALQTFQPILVVILLRPVTLYLTFVVLPRKENL